MPLDLSEYQRGQLFAVSETSKNETGGGDGVEVIKQEEFTSSEVKPGKKLSGIYTHKIYRTKSKSPWMFRKVFPDSAFILHEECWNAFPYCKTVLKNPDYMKESFYVIIESTHLADRGETDNALNLTASLMKKREVVLIDIYDDSILKKTDIKPDTDVHDFEPKKCNRGKLKSNWMQTMQPIMCCYKVVQVHFKMFGMQSLVERTIHKQYPRVFSKFNRELYCWMDKWYDMSLDDIKKMEEETAEQLKNQIADSKKRGTVCDVGEKTVSPRAPA